MATLDAAKNYAQKTWCTILPGHCAILGMGFGRVFEDFGGANTMIL